MTARHLWCGDTRLVVVALVILTACSSSATEVPSELPSIAASGAIVTPSCPPNADCGTEFELNGHRYSLVCRGVKPQAVADDTLGTGGGAFDEARSIEGLPPSLWLAVRGDLPCRPASGEPLEHEWYLFMSEEVTQADLEEFGSIATDATLP